jgi:hypothetical protein
VSVGSARVFNSDTACPRNSAVHLRIELVECFSLLIIGSEVRRSCSAALCSLGGLKKFVIFFSR